MGWKQEHLRAHIGSSNTCIYDDVTTLGAHGFRSDVDFAVASENAERPKAKAKAKAVKDLNELAKTPHHCIQHDKPCTLPTDIFILKSGFSCKGNSRMNVRFAEYRTSMARSDLENTSVSTFYGTLGVIASVRPKICVGEC